jgi:hypothetical protein
MLGRETQPYGYDTGFVIRGWIVGDHPCTIVLATWPRAGSTLRREMQRLTGHPGAPLDVPGARGARRHALREHVDEGVVLDDYERHDLTIAAARQEFVSLTIRTPDDDIVTAPVEAVVASFRLT